MQDEPLTQAERDRLAGLPREVSATPELEDRVVAALRADGRLRRKPVWLPRVARVAAALVLLAVGFVAGRAAGPAGSTETAPSGNQFLLLLYGGTATSPAEEAARVTEYAEWAHEQAVAGRLVAAQKLAPASAVLGPGTAAPLDPSAPAGFFLIRAATPGEAADIARQCPHLRHGGTIVIRPVDPTG